MGKGWRARLPAGTEDAGGSRDDNGVVVRPALSRRELAVAVVLCVLHTAGNIYGLSNGGLFVLLAWFGVVMLAGIGFSVFLRLPPTTTP